MFATCRIVTCATIQLMYACAVQISDIITVRLLYAQLHTEGCAGLLPRSCRRALIAMAACVSFDAVLTFSLIMFSTPLHHTSRRLLLWCAKFASSTIAHCVCIYYWNLLLANKRHATIDHFGHASDLGLLVASSSMHTRLNCKVADPESLTSMWLQATRRLAQPGAVGRAGHCGSHARTVYLISSQ